jgi:hypothetical protein
MASNQIVNKFADDLRRNLDAESVGIRVVARDCPKYDHLMGRITISTDHYRIKMDLIDRTDRVSVRVIDRADRTRNRRFVMNTMDLMGYAANVTGRKVVSNVVFNRKHIAKLAVRLAA